MSKERYLTKSRFKEGLECPTKLYYSKNSEYQNNQLDDPFLESLAEGGYQVGELAKSVNRIAPDPTDRPWLIGLSASYAPKDKEKALDAGMNDFIKKPLNAETFNSSIQQLLSSYHLISS